MKEYDALKLLALGTCAVGTAVHADLGLVGGETQSSDAYAALIEYPSGNLVPVAGLPANAVINSVAINSSGLGIIVGAQGSNGYAAFVSSTGTLTPISAVNPPVGLSSASINTSGTALIGGGALFSGPYYAAFVATDGTVTPLTLTSNPADITSVGINDAGVGLLGGEGNSMAFLPDYAAYFSSGTEMPLDFPPNEASNISSVSINSSGNGIVGGYLYDGSALTAYAGLATSGQTTLTTLSPLPNSGSFSYINSVAINDQNVSVMGGQDGFENAYAGYCAGFADASNVQALFPSPFPGEISCVAINNSGLALIGGYNNASGNVMYAALVQPDGTVTPLISSPPAGQINSVSIDNQGVGLIGGQIGSEGYLALVAPNGSLTPLDLSDVSVINAVAINYSGNNPVPTPNPSAITSLVTPQAVGAFQTVSYTQLAAVYALEFRFMQQSRNWRNSESPPIAHGGVVPVESMIAANDLSFLSGSKQQQQKTENASFKKNSLWLAPFGDYVHLQQQGKALGVDSSVGGALLGYDRQGKHFLIGGALGYAYNHLHYAKGVGHGNVQEEMGTIYGAYYSEHFWLGLAVWGGFYQWSNVRHAKPSITAKFKTHGWILDPHIEFASPWKIDSQGHYLIEPFVQADWINTWQKHFTETGASGFNVVMKGMHGSLLQSEIGLRFFEEFAYQWGDLWLEEKASYVNQAPFFSHSVTTSFVASASTFPVAVASNKVQNLGCALFSATFNPRNSSYPYGGIVLQAMGNGNYQSYFASVFIGRNF